MRIAIIGYGRMATEYQKVIEFLGHEVCCFMKKNKLVHLNPITPVVYDCKTLLKYNPDAVIVAVSQENTVEVLYQLLLIKFIPCLVEKPVLFESKDINRLWNNDNIKIGYNRRFYKGVLELNAKLKNHEFNLKSVYVNLPEPIEEYRKSGIKLLGEYPLHYSASHVIDLLFYLLGHIKVEMIYRNKNCYTGLLMADEIEVPILFKSVFNAPEHTEMTFNFEDEVWTFCPIEELRIYDKLVKNNNSYYQNIKKEIIEDRTFKPGLVDQVKQFLYFNTKDNLATLEDAVKVSDLCNQITGRIK
uniref:Putative oxidoreductase family protein n=1 Tax=viral metagenome TaxID=1070528 RepID=A0A6M3KUQ5_9ZZZZ